MILRSPRSSHSSTLPLAAFFRAPRTTVELLEELELTDVHDPDKLPWLRKEHKKQHCDRAARVNGKWLEHEKQRVTPLTLPLAALFWAPPTVEFEVHGPERGHYRSSLSQHNEQWQQLGISPVFLRKHSRDPALQHYQAEKLDAQETNKANGKCQCRECQHRREEEVTNRNQRFIGTFPNYTIGAGAGTDLSEEDCSNKTTYSLSQVVRLLLTEESGRQRLDHDRGSLQRAHDQSGGARPMNPRTQSGQLERVIGGGSQGGRSNSGSGVSYPFLDIGPEDSERYGYQSSHFYHPVSGLFETTEVFKAITETPCTRYRLYS